jgi:hypothetical protein
LKSRRRIFGAGGIRQESGWFCPRLKARASLLPLWEKGTRVLARFAFRQGSGMDRRVFASLRSASPEDDEGLDVFRQLPTFAID